MNRRRLLSALLFPIVLWSIIAAGCKDELPPPPVVGPEWVTFTHSTVSAIPSDNIKNLYLDGENTVWIGTDNGAVSYNDVWTTYIDSLQYYTVDGSAASITAIHESSDGAIWFGTAAGGVRRFNRYSTTGKTWVRYDVNTDTDNDGNPDIPYSTINGITAIRTGTPAYVYVATDFGLERFTPNAIHPELGTWLHYSAPPLPNQSIKVISINPATNHIILGTLFDGVGLYDEPTDQWSYYRFASAYDYPVDALVFDPWSNTAWMGKWEGVTSLNLALTKDSSYTNTNTSGNLPSGKVTAIAIQSSTSRWFGTTKGLVNLSGSTWTTYTHATNPELPSDNITALVYDGSGNLWIGTTAGIAVYNPKGTSF
jgi:ligand-binding sensor domain-containing protein